MAKDSRMAGVGGQGVVTGSHISAPAVIRAAVRARSSLLRVWKRMAPVESYVRVSDEPI